MRRSFKVGIVMCVALLALGSVASLVLFLMLPEREGDEIVKEEV